MVNGWLGAWLSQHGYGKFVVTCPQNIVGIWVNLRQLLSYYRSVFWGQNSPKNWMRDPNQ
jgi:hypothetical protein